jgi:hypothetical protein
MWGQVGSTKSESLDPAENGIDKLESARPGEVGSMGSTDSTSFSGIKKKKIGRNRKKARRFVDPIDPTREKSGESGLDKPKKAGSTESESLDPALTPNDGSLTPNGLIRTDEGVQEAIRKLKGDK